MLTLIAFALMGAPNEGRKLLQGFDFTSDFLDFSAAFDFQPGSVENPGFSSTGSYGLAVRDFNRDPVLNSAGSLSSSFDFDSGDVALAGGKAVAAVNPFAQQGSGDDAVALFTGFGITDSASGNPDVTGFFFSDAQADSADVFNNFAVVETDTITEDFVAGGSVISSGDGCVDIVRNDAGFNTGGAMNMFRTTTSETQQLGLPEADSLIPQTFASTLATSGGEQAQTGPQAFVRVGAGDLSFEAGTGDGPGTNLLGSQGIQVVTIPATTPPPAEESA